MTVFKFFTLGHFYFRCFQQWAEAVLSRKARHWNFQIILLTCRWRNFLVIRLYRLFSHAVEYSQTHRSITALQAGLLWGYRLSWNEASVGCGCQKFSSAKEVVRISSANHGCSSLTRLKACPFNVVALASTVTWGKFLTRVKMWNYPKRISLRWLITRQWELVFIAF